MMTLEGTSIPLGVIIPVYNEAENIGRTLTALREQVRTPCRIYIVYDFEEDNTLPVAREYARRGMEMIFLKNTQRGVLGAIKTGLTSAPEDYLLVTMADMSDDYSVVDIMCAKMSEGFDVICGSRYMQGGKQMGGPLLKKVLSRAAGISLNYLAGLPTHDVTNSFKLYRRSVLDSISIESDGGFEIGMEIVVKAHFRGFRVTEVPSIWMDRASGKSRFKILRWAPKYMRWYFYALKHRFHAHK